MKKYLTNIFSKRNLILIIINIISIILLLNSLTRLKIESSIYSILPENNNLKRSLFLTSHSSVMDKVIILIKEDNFDKMKSNIDRINEKLLKNNYLKNVIPDEDQTNEIRVYLEENALLLHNYKYNPFTYENFKTQLSKKYNLILDMPFEDTRESTFYDPLNINIDILKKYFINKRYLSIFKNGVLSEDKKNYIMILSCDFLPDNYKESRKLIDLEKDLKLIDPNIYVYSSHMYYQESYNKIQSEVSIIFVLSILLTIIIFVYFFRSIYTMFLSFSIIFLSISMTFFIISLFKNTFSGIGLAFGATSSGICIDYSIHYITKLECYADKNSIRKKVFWPLFFGFLTTFLSFFVVGFSKINSLKEISMFGCLVVTFSFISNFIFLHNLIDYNKSYCKLVNLPKLDRKFYYIFFIFLLIISIFLIKTSVDDNPYSLDMNHKKLDNIGKIIRDNFGESTDNVFIAFEEKSIDRLVEKSLEASEILEEKYSDLLFLNPLVFIPDDKTLNNRKEFIYNNFNLKEFEKAISESEFSKDSFNKLINDINNKRLELINIPNYFLDQYKKSIVQYEDNYYCVIHIGDRNKAKQIINILNDYNKNIFIVDILEDAKDGLYVFTTSIIKFIFLALVIIMIILMLYFKSIKLGLTSILPTIIGLIFVIGINNIFSIKLNIMHLTAMIIIIGIGVDYGIFTTTSIINKSEKRELDVTRLSVLVSTLTTLAGFAILSLSSSKALFSLGFSMFIGVIISFITSIYIIPLIVKE